VTDTQRRPRFLYQPLAFIRQTGTQRYPGGTTTYSFLAQVSKDLAPVTIRLTITPERVLSVSAHFDERMRHALEREQEDERP